MIIDKVENLRRYNLSQLGWEKLISYVTDVNRSKFQEGKFYLKDSEMFGIGLKYETKKIEECLWEAHRKYIDVHIMLKGEELIHINELSEMKTIKEYDSKDDYTLFTGDVRDSICLSENNFMILFPNEVHRGGILIDNPKKIIKIVVKVPYYLTRD